MGFTFPIIKTLERKTQIEISRVIIGQHVLLDQRGLKQSKNYY